MLLEVKDLSIAFSSRHDSKVAVEGLSFSLNRGETLAIVGESGSGKSVSMLALAGLLPEQAEVSGSVLLDGQEVMGCGDRMLREIRGKRIAYVFQEPATALNPYYTVGSQIVESLKLHRQGIDDFKTEAISLLRKVGIHDAENRYSSFPHEMSGGMKQRVVIAMALACQPDILVADEPTTGLDVTIEAQIIDLLRDLRRENDLSIILITHNFGIVDGFADRVAVMCRGKLLEIGPSDTVLRQPKHPYTRSLLACIPRMGEGRKRLPVVDAEFVVGVDKHD